MGKEASGHIVYGDQSGEGRILLEAGDVILRGPLKARLPRGDLTGVRAEGESLVMDAPGGRLTVALGAAEAERWVRALGKPVPTLAEKLGLAAGGAAWTWGEVNDPSLNQALAGCPRAGPEAAAVHLAVVTSAEDLKDALGARGGADAPLWLIYRKGGSGYGDAAIRTAMRGEGYVDSKSCAVSGVLTATRYGRRRT